jgi:hypothetical protein
MLNPFAIERDSMLRMVAIQEASIALRVKLCKSMLAEEKGSLPPKMRKELIAFVSESTPQPNKYECKICRARFNDGRKLGGHVSRAHKNKNEIREQAIDMEEEVMTERRTRTRESNMARNVEYADFSRPETNVKEEEMEDEAEDIY